MTCFSSSASLCSRVLVVALLLLAGLGSAQAQERADSLPNPLRLEDVLTYARDHRQEIVAARGARPRG